MDLKKHLIIVGLRRSGTTIVWETFRQDKRFLCFDEPYNFQVKSHCEQLKNSGKITFCEYLRNRNIVIQKHASIDLNQETDEYLTEHQKEYFKMLLSLNNNVCIDFTRCMLKIDELRKLNDNLFIVLLVRDWKAWVTSQLRPNNPLEYQGSFNRWGYEQIVYYLGIEKKDVVYKTLLTLWKLFIKCAMASKIDYVLDFELFCNNPEVKVKNIYDYLNLDYKELDYSKIHKANQAFQKNDKRWSVK